MTTSKPQSTTEETARLLPCPLFGHLPDKGEFTSGPYISVSGAPNMPKFYAVVCPGCCSTAYDEDKERVIRKWNTRVPASTAPVVDESELRFALEGMIAAFDTDDYSSASIVATTRECALSVAKQAVGWPAATTAAPPVDAETFVKQWIATLQDESHVTDEDAEDLVFRIIAYKNTTAAPVEQSDECTEISCAGCGRDTDTKLLLCPTCVDSGHEGAR